MLQCQLLDGLPSHFVQAFAVLRVWMQIIFMTPCYIEWFKSCLHNHGAWMLTFLWKAFFRVWINELQFFIKSDEDTKWIGITQVIRWLLSRTIIMTGCIMTSVFAQAPLCLSRPSQSLQQYGFRLLLQLLLHYSFIDIGCPFALCEHPGNKIDPDLDWNIVSQCQ